MAKLNRAKMDESTDSAHIRQVMGRYDLGLWEMSRLMNLEACAMASLILGESFLDSDQRLQLQRIELEMVFNRQFSQ